MSFNTEGEKCPVCHAYLFEEDDIVYCPDCGAPHHRDCYNHLGHCGLEELHGTDGQYDVAKAAAAKQIPEQKKAPKAETETDRSNKCRMCGAQIDPNERACSNCGAPNVANMNGFADYDFLGGVPGDMDIGDEVTADEAKRFVAVNTPRYIQKFAAMSTGKKLSWNWTAFLFPGEWLCARKMYILGIVVSIIAVAIAILSAPYIIALDGMGTSQSNAMMDIQFIAENIAEIGLLPIILLLAGFVFNITLRVVVALFGDYWYRSHTIFCIKKMRSESEDMNSDYRRYGGINFYAMLIALFAAQYLPSLILMLF